MRPAILLSSVAFWFWACSDAELTSDGFGGSSGGTPDVDDGGAVGVEPPEVEIEESFRSPVVSGIYLFSANPDSNRVALINAETHQVEVLSGGHAPSFLGAVPPGATNGGALVINQLSHDASVFLLADDPTSGESAVGFSERVRIQQGASAWAVGASGRYAIAWSRFQEGLRGSLDGYQDLTVLELAPDQVSTTELAVGFRPSQVTINEQETKAYVVSDPGISVIQLDDGEPQVVKEIFLPGEGGIQGRDVSLTGDGRLAFVRLEGEDEILIVDTETDERVTVNLPAVATDLDLSRDGSAAIAVMRGSPLGETGGEGGMGGDGSLGSDSRIAVLAVPGIFDAPSTFSVLELPEVVGSVVISGDGSAALLFTNATPNHHLTVLDVESELTRRLDLKAPVLSAFVDEQGLYGAAVMKPPVGSQKGGAFALFEVAEARAPRIEGTDAPPQFVTLAGAQERALVTTSAEGGAAVSYMGRFPSLRLDRVDLLNAPLASGIIPAADKGFVAQEHPSGQVTFIDLSTGQGKNVTGFELEDEVVQ